MYAKVRLKLIFMFSKWDDNSCLALHVFTAITEMQR